MTEEIDLMAALKASLSKRTRVERVIKAWVKEYPVSPSNPDLVKLGHLMIEEMGEDPIDQLHSMAQALNPIVDWVKEVTDENRKLKAEVNRLQARVKAALDLKGGGCGGSCNGECYACQIHTILQGDDRDHKPEAC